MTTLFRESSNVLGSEGRIQGSAAALPIINADDFGASPEHNQAIAISFREGWINSASIMPTMAGFAEACDLVERNHLRGQIGLHLNLSEGPPLSSAIAGLPRFCDRQGIFHRRTGGLKQASIHLSSVEHRALAEEVSAQISRCVAAGIPPSHLDSHLHSHIEWAIGGVVIAMARKHGVPAVRIMRNAGPAGSPLK